MDITKEIRQRVTDYVKRNHWISRWDVIKGMTETPSDEIKSWGLTRSQVEELVRDTLWPGEKRKGKVLYSLSKRGDSYGSVDDALKSWDDPAIGYRVVPEGYSSNQYKVEKLVRTGKGHDSVSIAKHVPRKWAEEYVMHQIDPSLPKPGKIVGRDRLEVTGKAVLTSDIADVLKYGKAGRGLGDISDRPVFILKGLEEGVIVDGFLLVENKKAADKVLGAIEKRMDKKGWFEGSAEKKEAYRKEAKFPDYKNLYPSEYTNTWRILGAHYADGIHRVYLTNGKGEFGAVDLDKFAFVMENLPEGKLAALKSGPVAVGGWGTTEKLLCGPLAFFVENKPVALLMPLFIPPSVIPLPIKEAAGAVKAPEGVVLATVIENPPMSFAEVYKSVLKRKDTNKRSAIYTTVTEILGGYKDIEEARDDASELRKTGGRRYSPWGYEIGPETIEKAVKVKTKLHPSGFSKDTADGFLNDMRRRVQEYYDRGYTRDISKGSISAELVQHEYAPVGGNRDWWLEQAKRIVDEESAKSDVEHISERYLEAMRDSTTSRPGAYSERAELTRKYREDLKSARVARTSLQSVHDSRSELSKSSDERQEHSLVVESGDPRVDRWVKEQGRMDVRGVDTPKRKSVRKPRPKSKRRGGAGGGGTRMGGVR